MTLNKLLIEFYYLNDKNHFINFNEPDLVIKKIIRSSISDLICKGVQPKFYFISGSGNNTTIEVNLTDTSGASITASYTGGFSIID